MATGPFRAAPVLVVFDGQSLNNIPTGNAYPQQMMDGDFPTRAWKNVALGGRSVTVLANTATTQLNPALKGGRITGLIMCYGQSDLYFEGDTGATLYSQAVTYANNARTAGADWVAATTIPPSTDYDATMTTNRLAHNVLLMADGSNAFDVSIDVTAPIGGGTPETGLLGGTPSPTYYDVASPLHWTAAGATVAKNTVAPWVTAWLATL